MKTKKEVIAKLAEIYVFCSFKKDHVLLTYANSSERIYADSSLTTIYEKGVAHRDAVLAQRRKQEQEAAQLREQQERNRIAARQAQAAEAAKERAETIAMARFNLNSMTDSTPDDWSLRSFFSKALSYVEDGDKKLASFTLDLQFSPAYAMEWAQKMFKVAAEMSLGMTVLKLFNEAHVKGDTDLRTLRADMLRLYTDDVIRAARSYSCSTSVTSNEMEAARLAVKADFISNI